MKKLYLVYGNTWFGGYGEEIHIFGVFSSRKMAEKDLLSCCRSNAYIMTGPVPALIVSPSLDANGIIDKVLLDTEVKSISTLNNDGIKIQLKTKGEREREKQDE